MYYITVSHRCITDIEILIPTLFVDEEESDDDAGAEIELGSDDRLVFCLCLV